MNFRSLVLTFLFIFMAVAGARADDWPQWRGPDRSGVSKETGLLKAWPKDGPKLLWTFKNAGEGFSSCAIVGSTLYTLGTRGGNEIALALDVNSGGELWVAPIGPIFKAFGNWGHGPRSTPTIDGDRLYALGSQGDLVCLDLASKGKEVWRKNYQKDFGGQLMDEQGNWGYCESPLVDGPHLICTPGGENGTVVALDKKDGRRVWQSKELTNKAPDSSIMPAVIHGVRQYIQNSYVDTVGGFISGVAAKDGKLLWSTPILKGSSYDIAPTPIVKDNLVYVTTENTVTGCHCFEIDKSFKAKDLYSRKNQKLMKNNHGGVVLIGERVYGHCDKTAWVCQDLKTGAMVWEARDFLECTSGAITAADGCLYLLTDAGEVGLVGANPKEFKEISSFKLPETSAIPKTVPASKDSKIWAHPVVANGRLYVRAHDLVFCYDVKGK
jgi:outer membrane protein assembly factor BamB